MKKLVFTALFAIAAVSFGFSNPVISSETLTLKSSPTIELAGDYATESEAASSVTFCSDSGIDVYVDGEYIGTYECVTIIWD